MTADQIGGIVRAILAAIGGILVARGVTDEQTMATLTGALTTVAVIIWSIAAKRQQE